jgi:hypothetical protein
MNKRQMFPNKGVKPTKQGRGLYGEDLLQSMVCDILDICKLTYYSIPNGTNKSKFLQWLFKKTGLKAGVPDLHIPVPVINKGLYDGVYEHHGSFVEVKLPKGYVSGSQKEWHNKLKELGHLVVIIRSIDELIDFIKAAYPEAIEGKNSKIKLYCIQNPKTKQFIYA